MIDPNDPLAHLYADLEDDFEVEVPTRETTLEALTEAGPEVEVLSDSDVDELALLVKDRHDHGDSDDRFLADLGLGSFRLLDGTEADPDVDDDVEVFFDLNSNGLRVTRRLAEWEGLISPGATGTR